MQTNRIIDYLSFTINDPTMLPKEGFEPAKHLRGNRLYKEGYRTLEGFLVMWNEKGSRQGTHVVVGGEVLEMMRSGEYGNYANLIRLASRARNITRIDLTLDCVFDDKDAHRPPSHFLSLWNDGKVRTHARNARITQNYPRGKEEKKTLSPAGETLYIGGGKGSQALLRIYDKAAELKVDDAFWTRFELQLRAEQAQNAFDECSINGVEATVNRRISNYCSFDDETYVEMLKSENSGVFEAVGKRKKTTIEGYLSGLYTTLKKRACESEENYDKIAKWFTVGSKEYGCRHSTRGINVIALHSDTTHALEHLQK